MDQRLLREAEARRYLGGMSHGAFFNLRREGVIPCIRAGRAVYFDIADLDAAIERLRGMQSSQGLN